MSVIENLTRQREFVIFLIVVAVFVAMIFASPYFLTTGNLLAVLLSLSMESMIAVGMVNLMVSGGFDLSVGSMVGFSGVMVAMAIRGGWPTPVAVVSVLLLGTVIGFINGFIVAKIGINPFVATLSSLSIYRGLTFVLTSGRNISGLSQSFKAIGQTRIAGIQLPIIYGLILIVVGDRLLRNSRFFRQNYYIGGNEQAARLSGINVDRMKIINYCITAVLATAAGIVFAARMSSSSCQAGTGWELRVITAVILGGASLKGGAGTVLGAFLGVLLMALITNSLTLLGVDVYWQQFVIGMTLLTAVLIDNVGKMKKEGKTLSLSWLKSLMKI